MRAILRSSAFGRIEIMFPIISSLEEWRQAKEVLDEVKNKLDNESIKFDKGNITILLEGYNGGHSIYNRA